LEKGGYSTFLGGNIGNVLLDGINKSLDFAVVELSSFQLQDYYPYSDCAIITNVTENHLDWHRNMNEYIKAKANILKNANRKIVCYDNEISKKIGMNYEDTIFYSLNDISSVCKECFYVKDGYFLHNKQRLFKCDKVLLRGDFNLLNILASLCATCGIVDIATQELAINSFRGVSGRLEFVKNVNDVSFFSSSIDTTPSRTISTLSAFDKKKTVVILGGYDKNLSYDILRDSLAPLKCAIILGENKNKIISALSKTRYIAVNTLSEAVITAFKLCESGDYVVLSPASASFDMFESYLERDKEFKKIVNTLH
jgi:UDP-N-acetylmuramoylalanine--D-glutamate ligase